MVNMVVFVDPGLVVSVMSRELDSGVLVDGVVGMPVAKREFG